MLEDFPEQAHVAAAPRVDRLLHVADVEKTPPSFRVLHRWYLATSTAQWIVSVVLAGATIRVWREGDAGRAVPIAP